MAGNLTISGRGRTLAMTTTAALLLAGTLAALTSAAAEPFEVKTQNGVQFTSGGVGDAEQARLEEIGDDYNVRVTLTQPDGAYLADVELRLEDASGDVLVSTVTRGPVFFAQLEPGRYVLHTSVEGRTPERRVIDVTRGDDQVRLYVAMAETGQAQPTRQSRAESGGTPAP